MPMPLVDHSYMSRWPGCSVAIAGEPGPSAIKNWDAWSRTLQTTSKPPKKIRGSYCVFWLRGPTTAPVWYPWYIYIYFIQVLLCIHCIYNIITMTMYPCLVVSHSPVFVDQASSDSLIEENEETPREAEVQAVARRKLSRLSSSVSVVAQWLQNPL